MAHRHKMHKAGGGKVHGGIKKGIVDYSGGKEHVAKEAEERKHGGRTHHEEHEAHGHKGKHRLDKRARGGRLGHGVHKSGGGDCTKSPFTAAHVRTSGDA